MAFAVESPEAKEAASQIARLNVEDLQADLADPRLMMPSSKKGKKGHTKLSHHPVPILVDLAKRLQGLASCRPGSKCAAVDETGW